MPFKDGKWIPPGGEWAKDYIERTDRENAHQGLIQAEGDNTPYELPPSDYPAEQSANDNSSNGNTSDLPEGVSPEFAANHPDFTNFMNTVTSPIRNFLNNTALGEGIQRLGRDAAAMQTAGASEIGREQMPSTGNDTVDKAIDFASMIPGTLIGMGGINPLGNAMDKGAELGDLGYQKAGSILSPIIAKLSPYVDQVGVNNGINDLSNIVGQIGNTSAKMAASGVPYELYQQYGNLSNDSLAQRAENIADTALNFGLFGAATHGAWKGIEGTGIPSKIMDFINKYRDNPTDTPLNDLNKVSDQTELTQDPIADTIKPTEEPTIQDAPENSVAFSPVEQNFMDLLSKNGKTLDDVESEFQKINDNHLNTELNYLAESGGKGVEQGQIFRDENGDVIGRQGRQSNNPQWYQDFYAEKGRAPSPNELVDLAYQRLREGSQEAPANEDFLKNEQALNFIQGLKDKINPTRHEGVKAYSPLSDAVPKNADNVTPRNISEVNLPKAEENTSQGSIAEGAKGFFGKSNSLKGSGRSEETIARNQVVNNIRKNLGLSISTGRLSSRGALGEYKVQPEVVRTARAEDISTIAHEIGHHLEKRFNLVDPAYDAELQKLAAPLVKGNKAYTPGDYAEEGLAEFFRRYLTEDHAQLKQDAPQLYDHILNKLDGQKIKGKLGQKYDVMKGLEQTRNDIHTWMNQGEINQAIGKIDFTSGERKDRMTWNKFYTRFVDDLNPLKIFEKDLRGKVGIGEDSIYKMSRNSRGIAEAAHVAIERGIYLNGQKIGDGLAQIVKPLEELGVNPKEFTAYLIAKHADDLKNIHGKETTFDQNEINALKSKFDGTKVEQIQKQVVQYNRNLARVLEDAQILKSGTVVHWEQQYPNYVPFMRFFDDDAIAGFKNGGFGNAGFANLSNPVKRMSEEGSDRTIVNPLESMVKNTFLVMNAAAKNKVGLQLGEMAKIDGAGPWVEHLGEGGRDSKEHIVTVFQDGKPNQYKVRDPELYNAMLSLDHESSNTVIRWLGGAASLLRSGAVLTPEFMARNVFRDNIEAFVNAGLNPLMTFKGLFHVMRKDEMFDQFLASGGANSVLMSLDRDFTRESLKKVFHESIKDKAMNVVTSPKELMKLLSGYTPVKGIVKGLRKGAEISELSTRVGMFEQALKKTGSFSEAAFQARDLMDFNRSGSNIRQMNRAVAFMNAQIQGPDKMFRSLKENPASYLTRAAVLLVLPSIAIHYWNKNLQPDLKQIYDNIPDWEKNTFHVFNIPGTKLFARIPKPFEAGMLFSTGTDKILQYLDGKDPKAASYGKDLALTFVPNFLPTAIMPLVEAWSNYSFFQNRSIVPQSEQKLEKKDQYGPSTSELAKVIGKVVDKTPLNDTNAASPRIIDNTIKGYTAGLGQYGVKGLDAALNALGISKATPQPEKYLYEQPPFNAFIANTNGGGQIRQDFYDRLNQLQQEANSAKKENTQMPQQDRTDYARMSDVKRGIDKLVKVYKQAQADPKLDPQRKREILDGLDQRMNQLSQIGLRKAK